METKWLSFIKDQFRLLCKALFLEEKRSLIDEGFIFKNQP